MTSTGQRNFSSLEDGLLDRTFKTKNDQFLYDLLINKARKLEVAESNPIMENIPVSFSLSVRAPFLPFLVPVLSLSRSISLFFLSLSPFMPHFSCCYKA